ncbi:MAG: hypothetical protein U1F68_00705 [Gammaproteobacteria bacterium]
MDKLRGLGCLQSPSEAERLQRTLAARQNYEVLIQNVHALPEHGEVALSFEQVDRWYDRASYSAVVDYATRHLTLAVEDCRLTAINRK